MKGTQSHGVRYYVEIIDTWNMTISRLSETYEGSH
ncbi:DUF5605 domain-containing protein [Cohnella herbarum]|uniref:DUF5605 domain-containing protein n=1 Tax=Cohnella herbarum TaxID=2728023 RepID=A0A7Z2VSG5_9BACL|nr:DUF5605 domain-containing protein [Cohnella herbarum]